MKDFFGIRHAFLVSSGKAALALILLALKGIKRGKKVVVPAYACYTVPSAVMRAGLSVFPCDVDPDTLDYNYESLRIAVDDDTLCVVAIHPFGIPADIARTREVCAGKGVFVVEDAAQAMGIAHEGRMLGASGDAGFISLGRGKAVTCGSGGVIVTDSEAISRRIEQFRSTLEQEGVLESLTSFVSAVSLRWFLTPGLYWIPNGVPWLGLGETVFDPDFPMRRFSRFKAGLLSGWQGKLDRYNRSRLANSRFYANALMAERRAGLCRFPRRAEEVPCIRFPLLLGTQTMKNFVCPEGRATRLGISPMYPGTVTGIGALERLIGSDACPRARAIADTLVTLPTHPMLVKRDREDVVAYVKAALASAKNGERQPA